MKQIAGLEVDFSRFRDDFEVVGKHLERAEQVRRGRETALRLEMKLERAADLRPPNCVTGSTRAPARARRRVARPAGAPRRRRRARDRDARRRSPRPVPPCRQRLVDGEIPARQRPLAVSCRRAGQLPSTVCARPHAGQTYAGTVGPVLHEEELDAGRRTRPAAFLPPVAARPFRAASSRQRSRSASSRRPLATPRAAAAPPRAVAAGSTWASAESPADERRGVGACEHRLEAGAMFPPTPTRTTRTSRSMRTHRSSAAATSA